MRERKEGDMQLEDWKYRTERNVILKRERKGERKGDMVGR